MTLQCFEVEHVLGRIRSEGGAPMVTALQPTGIKTLPFAVIDAIHNKILPTLHNKAMAALICPYLTWTPVI